MELKTHIREKLLTIALLVIASNGLFSQSQFDKEDLNRKTGCTVSSYTFECCPVWEYDKINDSLIRDNVIFDTLYPQKLISRVNWENNDIICSHTSSNDTLYVKVQRMEFKRNFNKLEFLDYLITATFTLTELPDIRYINFEFENMKYSNKVLNREKALGLIEEIKQLKKNP